MRHSPMLVCQERQNGMQLHESRTHYQHKKHDHGILPYYKNNIEQDGLVMPTTTIHTQYQVSQTEMDNQEGGIKDHSRQGSL